MSMNIKLGKTGAVVIGENVYTGKVFAIDGDSFLIDGVEVDTIEVMPGIQITVHGDVEHIDIHKGSVKARNVDVVNTVSGNVAVAGEINGFVKTVSGDVITRRINGAVNTVSGGIHQQGELQKVSG